MLKTQKSVFIPKIILYSLDVFDDIWVTFQDFKKGLALTLFKSLFFQYYLHTRFHICSGFRYWKNGATALKNHKIKTRKYKI